MISNIFCAFVTLVAIFKAYCIAQDEENVYLRKFNKRLIEKYEEYEIFYIFIQAFS